MEQTHDNAWERSLAETARRLDYPATPDIAAAIRSRTIDRGLPAAHSGRWPDGRSFSRGRRLVWATLVAALLFIALLAVPQTRAAVLSLFARIGAIHIFIDETVPTSRPTIQQTRPVVTPATSPVAPLTPAGSTSNTVDLSLALIDLGEPVSLDEARRMTWFDLALPAALGEPDETYIHRNVDLPAVTFVWREGEGEPLSLTVIGIKEFAMKMVSQEDVKSTRVNDHPAAWLEGPHTLQLFGYSKPNNLLIESNVLIWADEGVTYRLEGHLSEAEMMEIAESVSTGP